MLRNATHADIPRLVELGRAMHAEAPHFSGLRFDGAKLGATIGHVIDHGFARVAVVDGRIVGGMLALATPHWFSPDLVACDLALFIDAEHRGGTAGPRLLQAYAEWARDMGAAIVTLGLTTGINTERTAAMCERMGWRRAGLVMEI